MSTLKTEGKDWYKIQSGDLIVCVKTRDALRYFPERIGKAAIVIKRDRKSLINLVLVDGKFMRVDLANWERVK